MTVKLGVNIDHIATDGHKQKERSENQSAQQLIVQQFGSIDSTNKKDDIHNRRGGSYPKILHDFSSVVGLIESASAGSSGLGASAL